MAGTASRGDIGAYCAGGCTFVVDTDKPFQVIGHGTPDRTTFGTFRPSGQQCTVDTPISSYDPNRSICNTVASNADGSVSQCVRPDGTVCASMGSSRLCYAPGETGERMTSDGKLATNRVNQGQTPTPPANQQNPQQIGSSTTIINNTTTTTAIFGGSGAKPGQSNVGVGGSDGAGSGSGNGNGNGEGEGDDDGPGGVGSGVGDFYEGSGKTLESVASAHANAIRSSHIYQFATGFVTAPNLGGSCPVFNITFFEQAINVDVFCHPQMVTVLGYVGIFILAVFAWAAFRIAIL